MSSVTAPTDTPDGVAYGLSSGLVDDQRAQAKRVACPRCDADLHGGPVTYWCPHSHAFTAATLMDWAERQRHRACERQGGVS